jgi:phosphate transport system substrate-binding protein
LKNYAKIAVAVFIVAIVLSAALGYLYTSQPPQTVALSGSGATFPAPLLTAMITNYHDTKTNVQINYDAVGSSKGIAALESKTADSPVQTRL